MAITATTPTTAHITLGQLDSITDAIAAKEATKVDKVAGKQLSTEDYSTAEKTKLAEVAEGAQVNVIEAVKVNGEALTITDKGIDIDLSEYAKSADLTTALTYKGTVATYAELPTKDGVPQSITAGSSKIDCFEIDVNGGIMAIENFTESAQFELDENGDIMPKEVTF